jgi:pimeloyl-ACP methyl ester carboxylesterase
VTTCYRLLAGAVPDLHRDAARLVRRLAATSWSALPDEGSWWAGVPEGVARGYAEAWTRWLAQPPAQPLGTHEIVAVADGAVHTVRFPGAGQVPILLLHGWPTSFLAFHRVIDPLLELASELVLVTIPGFGRSPLPPAGPSVGPAAELILGVMERLGHSSFVVHGQDWGSVIAREIGVRAPDRVRGVHVSAGLRGFLADGRTPDQAWERLREFAVDGAGYLQLQSRRPDSIAVALADSPAGLLTWQLDKYQLWQSALGADFGLGEDFILANATLYWATNSIGGSLRIYAANRDTVTTPSAGVPTGVSVFGSGDFASAGVAGQENNLVAWYEHPTGGHVAALDAPDEFVADLTDFLSRLGPGR